VPPRLYHKYAPIPHWYWVRRSPLRMGLEVKCFGI
jgi:hypothetical protein